MTPKLRIMCPTHWHHHRGGWPYCVEHLRQHFHTEHGVLCYTNTILVTIDSAPLEKPWTAFMHVTPLDHLEKRAQQYNWQLSLPHCRGVYVFSQYTANYVSQHLDVPINVLQHPCAPTREAFTLEKYHQNPNKKVVHVGHWLRKPERLCELDTKLRKVILNCTDQKCQLPGVETIDFLPPLDYDIMMSRNVVFLYLEESSVNNTILECIVRNTPVLVNRHPAVEEYLGSDYPLFYESMEDASKKLNQIEAAHEYLAKLDKHKLHIDHFIESIGNSEIYQRLPKPFWL